MNKVQNYNPSYEKDEIRCQWSPYSIDWKRKRGGHDRSAPRTRFCVSKTINQDVSYLLWAGTRGSGGEWSLTKAGQREEATPHHGRNPPRRLALCRTLRGSAGGCSLLQRTNSHHMTCNHGHSYNNRNFSSGLTVHEVPWTRLGR
jgi:hypothetical protein